MGVGRYWAIILGVLGLGGCSSGDPTPPGSGKDPHGRVAPAPTTGRPACEGLGRCQEPEQRLDFDNVVSYGKAPTQLTLPDPPKSGFRIIAPLQQLTPGEEMLVCRAWSYPQIRNKYVYAARMYTSGNIHHSNVLGLPLASSGASPYPECADGQGNPMTQTLNLILGTIPDTLFTNSTQINGGEQLVFPAGMAFKLTTEDREIVSAIHYLNTSAETVTSEVVYDFFTAPEEDIEQEVVPFVYDNQDIDVPPRSTKEVEAECSATRPAKIVSLLPHAHARTSRFSIDLVAEDGTVSHVLEDSAFDGESRIRVFEEPLDLTAKLRYSCTVENNLDRTIRWGIGDDEMCMIFGYLYPPEAQQSGFVKPGTGTCQMYDFGSFRM
jgi:hypothetical protein